MEEALVWSVTTQALSALKYLEEHQIKHLDLKRKAFLQQFHEQLLSTRKYLPPPPHLFSPFHLVFVLDSINFSVYIFKFCILCLKFQFVTYIVSKVIKLSLIHI